MKRILYAAAALATLSGGCTKEPSELRMPDKSEERSIELYIPAPERVETYSGATLEECRIDNAAVLSWDRTNDVITGAEIVDIIYGNGTQNPTLQLKNLFPQRGETVIVLCNLDPADLDRKVTGCLGRKIAEAQTELLAKSARGGFSAQMEAPLTMAGEMVWGQQTPPLHMTFQCAKISVVMDPALIGKDGPLGWTIGRGMYCDRVPEYTRWHTESIPALPNYEGTLQQNGGYLGYKPEDDPMTYPAMYVYEAQMPVDWPANRAFNYILLQVSDGTNPMQYYCLTYDETADGVLRYRPFERGRHYVFRIRNIYKRGYENIYEALDNPSNAVYDIEVSDDWSKTIDYNGQYGVIADRDTAYVWATAEPQKGFFRLSWPQPEGDPDGAPQTSFVALVQKDRKTAVPTSLVQLLDRDGQPVADNRFTFAGEQSPDEGYMFGFKAGNNTSLRDGMYLHIRCGNIEKFIPVGVVSFSVQNITTDYKGGTFAFESQAVMPDGNIKQLDWETRFTDEDGNHVSKPDWIDMPTEGTGSAEVTVKPQLLQAPQFKEPVTNWNLANASGASRIENTANCYIVNAAGSYSLPLVYGNAVKDGKDNRAAYNPGEVFGISGDKVLTQFLDHMDNPITSPYIYESNGGANAPDGATLVWQDADGLIDPNSIRLSADKRHLTFTVDRSGLVEGNAVIAATKDGTIVWSWHIWVTAYDLGAPGAVKDVTNWEGVTFRMMTKYLGTCSPMAYPGREVYLTVTQPETGLSVPIQVKQEQFFSVGDNCYYQHGRKDPFPGVSNNNNRKNNKRTYGPEQYIWPASGVGCGERKLSATDIASLIQNPSGFATENSHILWYWMNPWDSGWTGTGLPSLPVTKTVYDPSPVGFCVPPGYAFTGFSKVGPGQKLKQQQLHVHELTPTYIEFYTSPDKFAAGNKATITLWLTCWRMRDDGKWLSNAAVELAGAQKHSHSYCYCTLVYTSAESLSSIPMGSHSPTWGTCVLPVREPVNGTWQ